MYEVFQLTILFKRNGNLYSRQEPQQRFIQSALTKIVFDQWKINKDKNCPINYFVS